MLTNLLLASGLVVAGMFAWTLAEYVLHRFVMHEMVGKGMPSREHLIHHADPQNNPGRPLLSWIGIIVVGAVLFGWSVPLLTSAVVGSGWVGLAMYAGWLLGYGTYEQIHERSHFEAPRGRYTTWVRRHHFHHHNGHPMANHGVTTPLWDKVFGTLEVADVIRVPRRQAMCWLVDDDGEVKAEYAPHYVLVGPAHADERLRKLDAARAFMNLPPADVSSLAHSGDAGRFAPAASSVLSVPRAVRTA